MSHLEILIDPRKLQPRKWVAVWMLALMSFSAGPLPGVARMLQVTGSSTTVPAQEEEQQHGDSAISEHSQVVRNKPAGHRHRLGNKRVDQVASSQFSLLAGHRLSNGLRAPLRC